MNQLRVFAIKGKRFVVAVDPKTGRTGIFIQTKEGIFHTAVKKGKLSDWINLFKQVDGGLPNAVQHYFSFVEISYDSEKVVLVCKYFPFSDVAYIADFSYDTVEQIVHQLWSARGFLDGIKGK